MKLVVGLGNPGKKYRLTRHNIGFLVLEEFLDRQKKKFSKTIGNALAVSLEIGGDEAWFIEPQSFMNLSGEVVVPFARKVKAKPEETLIVHDEADFEPGKIKLKFGGGTAGHNGLESIIAHWQTDAFWRIRVGVGKDVESELADHLLKGLSSDSLRPLAEEGADALGKIFELGPKLAMNRINGDQG